MTHIPCLKLQIHTRVQEGRTRLCSKPGTDDLWTFQVNPPGGRHHTRFLQVWSRDPLPRSAHTRAHEQKFSLSLSITTHHARTHTHTHTKASNKGKHSPIKALLLHLPVHTCQETKTIRKSCPGNMCNTPGEKQAPWHPPGRAWLYTQRTGAGLASRPGDQRTPRTGIRGSPPAPSRPSERNYPLFDP